MGGRLERNPAFDGIRTLAIFLVLAVHCYLPELPGGFIGVDIFFVLSGYLITVLLLKEIGVTGQVDIWRFYVRRALRLTPPLLSLLVVYVVFAPFVWPEMSWLEHVGCATLAGLYLSDYAYALAKQPFYLVHTWSLAVEEHYYLLWPVVLLFLQRLSKATAICTLIGAILVASIWRPLNLLYFLDVVPVYFRFDAHYSGLAWGSLLAIADVRIGKRFSDSVACLSLLVIAVGAATWVIEEPYYLIWGMPLTNMSAAALIVAMQNGNGAVYRLFSFRPMAYLGQISYAIYLWHYPFARYLREHVDPHLAFMIVVAISVPIAMLSWHLIEMPLQKLRHQYRRVGEHANGGPLKAV